MRGKVIWRPKEAQNLKMEALQGLHLETKGEGLM